MSLEKLGILRKEYRRAFIPTLSRELKRKSTPQYCSPGLRVKGRCSPPIVPGAHGAAGNEIPRRFHHHWVWVEVSQGAASYSRHANSIGNAHFVELDPTPNGSPFLIQKFW